MQQALSALALLCLSRISNVLGVPLLLFVFAFHVHEPRCATNSRPRQIPTYLHTSLFPVRHPPPVRIPSYWTSTVAHLSLACKQQADADARALLLSPLSPLRVRREWASSIILSFSFSLSVFRGSEAERTKTTTATAAEAAAPVKRRRDSPQCAQGKRWRRRRLTPTASLQLLHRQCQRDGEEWRLLEKGGRRSPAKGLLWSLARYAGWRWTWRRHFIVAKTHLPGGQKSIKLKLEIGKHQTLR